MSEFDLIGSKHGSLHASEIELLLVWQRAHGLRLYVGGGQHNVTASLDRNANDLVTELLRLAHLGIIAQEAAQTPDRDNKAMQALVVWADHEWHRRRHA